MSGARLSIGEPAPSFATRALDGTAVSVPAFADTGPRWTLVSFLRYASCPMCNLRMRELARALPTLRAHRVTLVVVVHSPAATALRFVPRELHPHVVADPMREVYRHYAVETSWLSMLRTVLMPSFYVAFLKATVFGYWGGRVDGPFAAMPADFVVSPGGLIRACRYGKHLGDHMSVDEVIAAAIPSTVTTSQPDDAPASRA